MRDLLDILDAAEAILNRGESATLATVVRVEGSSYRLPGARLLIDAAGKRIGSVSGGCLEADVARRGRLLTAERPHELIRYDGVDEIGCDGAIDVFIERLAEGPVADSLAFIRQCVRLRQTGELMTVFKVVESNNFAVGQRFTKADLETGETTTVIQQTETGQIHALVEVIRPPMPLLIFGAGHDAIPLARLGKMLGWHVTVCDRRAGYARADRFAEADEVLVCDPSEIARHITPQTAAVVMTHHYPDDLQLLKILLASPAPYIGVLGPASRTGRMLNELGHQAVPRRLHAPVGLDIGAEGPDQVAMSIVAEILASTNHRDGGSLRNRAGPIHTPAKIHISTLKQLVACK